MYLLALNCGSSSLKFRLLELPSLETRANGQASSIGSDSASLKVKPAKGSSIKPHETGVKGETHDAIFGDLLEALGDDVTEQIKVVTHRIVHGGDVATPLVVDPKHKEGLKKMDDLSSFAPLHNHHAVLTVRTVLDKLPHAKNVMCFDTLFHRSLPPQVYTYPVPAPQGGSPVPIRRYGFHGLSYSSILKNVAKHLHQPADQISLIVCHLGSGASMCCIRNGQSLDTTMGLTPLEGLPGGTRSGSVDPSLVFHLYREAVHAADTTERGGISITDAERKLNKDSGFQALAGTNDYGTISKKAAQGGEKEQLTVKVFENRIAGYLGQYLFLLENKPTCVVFSGGIGEKSVELRASIAAKMAFLGVQLDSGKNEEASSSDAEVVEISTSSSPFKLLRVLTDEELECAQLAMGLDEVKELL